MKQKEFKFFSNTQNIEFENSLTKIIRNFDSYEGGIGNRNIIKVIKYNGLDLNIKAFKIPNLINRLVYRFFRKSKAQRSFEYAEKLIEMNVGTPRPIAYFEFTSFFQFNKSFYISENLDCDMTYRKLVTDFNLPDYDKILRSFTRFTYSLHQKNVYFIDHSPGNTLIKKNGDEYEFYLVDLNRMKFVSMDFETRIKNFSKLTIHKSMVQIMSDEYAKCSGEDYNRIYDLMWRETEKFQEKYHKKAGLKKKLFFWRSFN
jgi:hypothetical protein